MSGPKGAELFCQMIKARIKDGPTAEYPTRILSHLNFAPHRPVQRSQYGGWADGQYGATGFFRTENIDGRWWLIDPAGNRFLHIAVNIVAPGRGPQHKQAFADRFPSAENWRDETAGLLQDHGFNGTGVGSSDELLAAGPWRPVYTQSLNFMGRYGRKRGGVTQVPGHLKYPNDCIFVFDPQFEAFADELARPLAAKKDDTYLLGYFSDNELPFFKTILDGFLTLPEGDPGRRAAEAWLARRKGCAADKSAVTDEDREAWREYVADAYFGIVGRAVRKYDPNHLFLGSRFYEDDKDSPALFRAAGRHLDVVSVNVYRLWTPTRDAAKWAAWAGKPVMITEWYAKGDDTGLANLTGAGWTVATQQERAWFYQHFALALLESRGVVGWHWFQYQDNDPSDQNAEPSGRNSNKGIVDVKYGPYRTLLDAMKQLNESAYLLTEYFDRGG